MFIIFQNRGTSFCLEQILSMDVQRILKAISFLSLETVGIPGNVIILACFFHYRIYNGKFTPVDMMLAKLSFINLIVVLIRGIPQSLTSMGINNLFGQRGCDVIMLAYRVFRAMSICVTSLLSFYQWTVLASSSSFWDTIKGLLIRKLSPIMLSLWCAEIITHLFSIYAFSWGLTTNSTVHVLNLDYCLVLFPSNSAFQIIGTVCLVRDLVFIILMIISSLCIVVVLYRHRRQVNSIRSADHDQKIEIRAAKAVIMLVSTYMFFFGLDNVTWLYTICASTSVAPELTFARVFFSCSYCAMSPFVIITTNKKVQSKLKFAVCKTHQPSKETTVSETIS